LYGSLSPVFPLPRLVCLAVLPEADVVGQVQPSRPVLVAEPAAAADSVEDRLTITHAPPPAPS